MKLTSLPKTSSKLSLCIFNPNSRNSGHVCKIPGTVHLTQNRLFPIWGSFIFITRGKAIANSHTLSRSSIGNLDKRVGDFITSAAADLSAYTAQRYCVADGIAAEEASPSRGRGIVRSGGYLSVC